MISERKEQAVRFGVRNNGQRSDTYKAWLGKDDSFYIGPREAKGAIKVSLHADGSCFFGFTEEFVRQHGADISPRCHPRLERFLPRPLSGSATRVATVTIPAAAVNRIDPAPRANQVTWLPTPRPHHAREIACFLTTTIDEVLSDNVVGRLNNRHCSLWIAHREVPFTTRVALSGTPVRMDRTPLGPADAIEASRVIRGLAIAIRPDDGSCVLEEVPSSLGAAEGHSEVDKERW